MEYIHNYQCLLATPIHHVQMVPRQPVNHYIKPMTNKIPVKVTKIKPINRKIDKKDQMELLNASPSKMTIIKAPIAY